MKISLFVSLLLTFFSHAFSKTTDIYVSKKRDAFKGEYVYPTLNAAIEQAHKLSSRGSEQLRIVVLEGAYHLTKTIEIDSRLNGLSIEGLGSDLVTFNGSVPLKLKWKKEQKQMYSAQVKNAPDFDQLVINGELKTLARYPNYSEKGGAWQGYAADAISPERLGNWKNISGAVFHAMHGGKWGGMHYKIMGVDKKGEALLEGGFQNNRPSKPHKDYRMLENVFEELDDPGEWFFDKEKSKIYYMPLPEENMDEITCEAVVLKSLIEIKGTQENPVENIRIQGIKFEHAKRTIFEQYEQLLRSDWSIHRGGALFLSNAENCVVENCEFSDLGGNAIFVSGYNHNHLIKNNHIHDNGASAICFVGKASAVRSPAFTYHEFVEMREMDKKWGPKTDEFPSNCVADGNLIYRIGRIEKQTAGIQIAMAMNITARHNSIYDVPRAGINIGDGTWGGHLIEYNDVFNTVLETGDHGSFNSWGRDRFWHPKRDVMNRLVAENPQMPYWDAAYTTIIRNNRFRCDHGWDIDLDDGSTNYHIYSNLCLNGGLKLREGFGRIVENNILVNNALHPHVWFNRSGDVFRRNIVAESHKDVGVNDWGREIDYNLFANEISLMKAQVYHIDEHSDFGNPKYNDPDALDFSVSEDSPALGLGFVNFPMNKFGVQSPTLKKIAKTPEIPDMNKSDKETTVSPAVEWLRAKIKSVDSKEEQSAYGLDNTNGVIILRIGAHSIVGKSGLKSGDVILKAQGETIKDIKHFFYFLKNNNELKTLDIEVMRNQREQQLNIQLR